MPVITQVFLPMRDSLGRRFGAGRYEGFHARMMRRFTGWTRKGMAQGAWLSGAGEFCADEHWVHEIVHRGRHRRFWQAEKERLKVEFEQDEIWIIQFEGHVI